jgi:hypothetical protein
LSKFKKNFETKNTLKLYVKMGQFTIFLLLLLTFFSLPSGVATRRSRPPQDDACTRCHRILDYKQTIAKAHLRYVRDVLDEACQNMDSKVVDICDDQAENTTQAMVHQGRGKRVGIDTSLGAYSTA